MITSLDVLTPLFAVIYMVLATMEDRETSKIPNALTYAMVLSGLTMFSLESTHAGSLTPILSSLATAGAMFGVGWLAWRMKSLGGGDVKLMAGLGALMPITALYVFALAYIGLGVYQKVAKDAKPRPFAPFLLASLCVVAPIGIIVGGLA